MGKKILDIISGGLMSEIRKLVDNVVTTKAEKMELANKLTEIETRYKVQLESELTKRHQNDMLSDSWLSKNIRPLSLIFFLFLVLVLIIGNGTGYLNVDKDYIALVKDVLMSMIIFYFGGRTTEKLFKLKKNN